MYIEKLFKAASNFTRVLKHMYIAFRVQQAKIVDFYLNIPKYFDFYIHALIIDNNFLVGVGKYLDFFLFVNPQTQ